MPDSRKILTMMKSNTWTDRISGLYGKDADRLRRQTQRWVRLVRDFVGRFPDGDIVLLSTPGRTEIGGNHTDHNHGRVLAAAVDLDSAAVCAESGDNMVTVLSEGYPEPFRVSLDRLDSLPEEAGTTSGLIRGLAFRLSSLGYRIGGFNALVQSDVPVGSGLSSSASVEVLLGTAFNCLFNRGRIPVQTLAAAGQFAENVYFKKPCGLMDQTTCAVGGIVFIDFVDPARPRVKKVPFDFHALGYRLLVVETGGSHADLTEDYASIPQEMQSVARFFGKSHLREVDEKKILAALPALRIEAGDRAVLRALHFMGDNRRVVDQVRALENGDFKRFLELVNESGHSSYRWLQNCLTTRDVRDQSLALALKLSEDFLKRIGAGACRVHGGGFQGTIQVFLPDDALAACIRTLEPVFGKGSVRILSIRPLGTIDVWVAVRGEKS